jgi:undecaprenyl-diphosphatase
VFQGFAVNIFLDSVLFLVAFVLVILGLRMAVRYFFLTPEERLGDDAQRPMTEPVGLIRRLLQVAGALAVWLVVLATLVMKWPGQLVLDTAVNNSLTAFRAPWLLHLFLLLTIPGTVIFATLAVATVSALLFWADRYKRVIPLWVAFVGAEFTTWVFKYIVNRTRPPFLDGIVELNPSFPSGHATASTVVLGFIGYMLASTLTRRQQRVEVSFWFAAVVASVCLSRLFLSLHYLSDVLAGLSIGGMWLLIGIAIAEWQKTLSWEPARWPSSAKRSQEPR